MPFHCSEKLIFFEILFLNMGCLSCERHQSCLHVLIDHHYICTEYQTNKNCNPYLNFAVNIIISLSTLTKCFLKKYIIMNETEILTHAPSFQSCHIIPFPPIKITN